MNLARLHMNRIFSMIVIGTGALALAVACGKKDDNVPVGSAKGKGPNEKLQEAFKDFKATDPETIHLAKRILGVSAFVAPTNQKVENNVVHQVKVLFMIGDQKNSSKVALQVIADGFMHAGEKEDSTSAMDTEREKRILAEKVKIETARKECEARKKNDKDVVCSVSNEDKAKQQKDELEKADKKFKDCLEKAKSDEEKSKCKMVVVEGEAPMKPQVDFGPKTNFEVDERDSSLSVVEAAKRIYKIQGRCGNAECSEIFVRLIERVVGDEKDEASLKTRTYVLSLRRKAGAPVGDALEVGEAPAIAAEPGRGKAAPSTRPSSFLDAKNGLRAKQLELDKSQRERTGAQVRGVELTGQIDRDFPRD